jgi:hypothetical protein
LSIAAAAGNGACHFSFVAYARSIRLFFFFFFFFFFFGSYTTVARIGDHARMGIVKRPHPRDRLSDVAVDQGSNDFGSEVEPEIVPLDEVVAGGAGR